MFRQFTQGLHVALLQPSPGRPRGPVREAPEGWKAQRRGKAGTEGARGRALFGGGQGEVQCCHLTRSPGASTGLSIYPTETMHVIRR